MWSLTISIDDKRIIAINLIDIRDSFKRIINNIDLYKGGEDIYRLKKARYKD